MILYIYAVDFNYHLKKSSLYLWIRYADSILYRVVIAMIFMTIRRFFVLCLANSII